MDSFLDTNIPLAYVFSIEPNNSIAKKIFVSMINIFGQIM